AALTIRTMTESNNSRVFDLMLICGTAALAPLISSGIFARVGPVSYPAWGLQWSVALPRILDLDNFSVFAPWGAEIQVVLAVSAWALLIVLALFSRSAAAAGLTVGPALLLIFVISVDAGGAMIGLYWPRSITLQTIGFYYPAVLCGAAVLLHELRNTKLATFCFLLMLLAIVQRVPRFVSA